MIEFNAFSVFTETYEHHYNMIQMIFHDWDWRDRPGGKVLVLYEFNSSLIPIIADDPISTL